MATKQKYKKNRFTNRRENNAELFFLCLFIYFWTPSYTDMNGNEIEIKLKYQVKV